MKILVVCLGNICRSPLAEVLLQKKASEAGLNWHVESAGTNYYHIGEPPHHLSQKVANINGLDISYQKARQFKSSDIENYDLIFAMDKEVKQEIFQMVGEKINPNTLELFLEKLYPGKRKDVPDPWYGPEQGFHEVYNLIEKAADAIISSYIESQKLILKTEQL